MSGRRFEISKFNINYAVGFKDKEHIELLKKQIERGAELSVDVYEEGEYYKIIDGGHTFYAYQELGKVPTKLNILHFENDAEKVAYSRHKNINRLQATPVAYTKSIFVELKFRLRVEDDSEVKKILRRFFNITEGMIKEKSITKEDKLYNNVIVKLFATESTTVNSFINNNIPYLDFPEWLAEMVDKGKLSAEQGRIINSNFLTEPQRKKIVKLSTGKGGNYTKLLVKLFPRKLSKNASPLVRGIHDSLRIIAENNLDIIGYRHDIGVLLLEHEEYFKEETYLQKLARAVGMGTTAELFKEAIGIARGEVIFLEKFVSENV